MDMKKIFCDICGKEITKSNETWKYELRSNEGNSRVSCNKTLEDVCEKCATIIHCCVSMMCECGWEPDFHESLNSDNFYESEKAAYKLYDFKRGE